MVSASISSLICCPCFTSEIFVAALWRVYNFFIKGTLTSESLWVAAFFTISVEKELFYVKFHAKFNDPFWKYQVLIQLQYNNVCKIHLDEPNGPMSIEIRIVWEKIYKGILHFSKCTLFLIWLWLKIVLVCKLISYHHLYSGLSSPGIFDKKHGCMIEMSLTCVSCKGELQRFFFRVQYFLYQFWSRS